MVRMGEFWVSGTPGHVLTSIGLGSCIGLVLVEARQPLAGLAHIMLPSSNGNSDASLGKFADKAIPALIEKMASSGARRSNLFAVLVGGAKMFSFGSSSSLEIGKRNEEATRDALKQMGIEVHAAATGGQKGRTVRVSVETGLVTVREPGAPEIELFSRSSPAARAK